VALAAPAVSQRARGGPLIARMHLGIISPPVPGHIHPFGALGRELIARGHRITLVHMEDVREKALKEDLEFLPVGQSDHPVGSLPRSLSELAKLGGLAAIRFTVEAVRKTTVMICRDAPEAIRASGIEALLVDQTEPAGGTVADYLKLPFITVCNALALNREDDVPPPFTDWACGRGWWSRLRNRAGYAVADRIMSPVGRALAVQRAAWGLGKHGGPSDSFSTLAQISQQPSAFDFPRSKLPPHFYYAGPLRGLSSTATPFPWERLDGRPLIYASLGTLQNRREAVFRCFAEACAPLDAQLVMTHGGGLHDSFADQLPGRPLVVPYAPQLELLKRARLALTHAGLNTVLDALSQGVPIVAVPITYEQPAIAARVRWLQAGEVLPLKQLNVSRLREKISRVWNDPAYARNAGRVAQSAAESGGARTAADIIEKVLK
jgi:zeaxanthin glucosyltransferase